MMKLRYVTVISLLFAGCMAAPKPVRVPALEFKAASQQAFRAAPTAHAAETPRASLHFVKDWPTAYDAQGRSGAMSGMPQAPGHPGEAEVYRSQQANTRNYAGPLSLGNPGVSSSLWQESRKGNNLFRDDKAWQPMDIVTILVAENAEGKKEADTDVKTELDILAGITDFLGVDKWAEGKNPSWSWENSINAETSRKFKGETETSRKGELKGQISAVVMEVLPNGLLRVAGEKIVSVNEEEQIMVVSGLVRTKDISSNNTVTSAKVAQMRIDYYGEGVLGDYQKPGWLFNAIGKVWPF